MQSDPTANVAGEVFRWSFLDGGLCSICADMRTMKAEDLYLLIDAVSVFARTVRKIERKRNDIPAGDIPMEVTNA